MSYFGNNIKKIRSVRGLTQQQLAESLDLTRGAVSSYEEGRAEPKIETILNAATFFNIPIEKLLTEQLTVNQLIGFKHPEVTLTNSQNANSIGESLPDFSVFQKDFIVIDTTKVLFESECCTIGQVILGKETKTIKRGLVAALHEGSWYIGEIESTDEKGFTLLEQYFLFDKLELLAQVLGMYSPVQIYHGILQRLQRLEDKQ